MGTRTQGRPRSRRGANAIEFALTAPVLIFLILGIMDYGWFFLNRILLESSTARVAYVGSIVIGDEAMTQGDIALMQGQSTWDNFNIPGDPTFTTEVQVVGLSLIHI